VPAPTGADERRIRQLLLARGVGPDAHDAAAGRPAKPAAAESSWWDDLYDTAVGDTHVPTARAVPDRARVTTDRLPNWRKGETTDLTATPDPAPEDKPGPDSPDAHAADGPDRPDDDPDWAEATDPDDPVERAPGRPSAAIRTAARRATAAHLTLPRRTRWFASTGAAAALGYGLGLVSLMQGWICSCGDTQDPTGALILGGVMVATGAAIAWHTRPWWPPLAWTCRIPLASALLALALYAPGVTS